MSEVTHITVLHSIVARLGAVATATACAVIACVSVVVVVAWLVVIVVLGGVCARHEFQVVAVHVPNVVVEVNVTELKFVTIVEFSY